MKHGVRKKHRLRTALIIVLILVICGFAAKYFIYDPAMEKAAETTYEKVIESATSDNSTESRKIKEAADSLSDSDKAAVSKIIKKHITASTAAKLLKYYKDGDYDKLKEFAQENLSDEEMAQLYEIYQKNSSN